MTISASEATIPVEHTDRFFIGGQWVTPSSDSKISVIDSHSEQVYLTVAEAQAADMDRAVTAAKEAFDHGPWPRLTHVQRAEYLRALAAGLRDRADDLSYIWSSEMGILHVDAVARGARVPGIYDFYAGLADSFEFAERHEPAGGGYGWLVREPVGVVGAIIPWNAAIVAMSPRESRSYARTSAPVATYTRSPAWAPGSAGLSQRSSSTASRTGTLRLPCDVT